MASPDVVSFTKLDTTARDLQPVFRDIAIKLDRNQENYNTAFIRGSAATVVGLVLAAGAMFFTMGTSAIVAGTAAAAGTAYVIANFIYKYIIDKQELTKAESMWTTFSSLYKEVHKYRFDQESMHRELEVRGAAQVVEAERGSFIVNLILIHSTIYDIIVNSLKSQEQFAAGNYCRSLAQELQKMVDEECWRCCTTASSSMYKERAAHTIPGKRGKEPLLPVSWERKRAAHTIPGKRGKEPLLSSCWEINAEFTEEGGRLCKPGSDVVLTVPPGAVRKGQKVTIYSAVCVDLDLMYQKLNISENEGIVSPLVEYFTPDEQTFDLNVSISLPHFLPSDVDLHSVKVYHVHHADDKKPITLTEIKRCDNSAEAGSSYCYTYNRDTKELQVYTNHFCSFFCVFFRKDRKQLTLFMRGYGTLEIHNNCQHVRVYAYLWDQRICLPDFIEDVVKKELSEAVPIELSRGQKNSKLQVQFDKGEDQPKLQHYRSANTRAPICPEETEFLLYQWIGCTKCLQQNRFRHKPFHWHLIFPEKHKNVESLFVFVRTISSSDDSSATESTILELVIESESKHRENSSNSSQRSSVSHLSLTNTSSIGSE